MQYSIISSLLNSPIGALKIVTCPNFVREIQFLSKNSKNISLSKSEKPLVLVEAEKQLKEYFNRQRKHFSLPLFLPGTSFQQQVWKTLQEIPFGETRSYQEIAQTVGSPKASRAIGMANHRNPLPIVIPCHRVIQKNGDLGGYAGGVEVKRFLLLHEN